MDCDICLKDFDQSLNKPLVLLNCAHTVCSFCVNSLLDKKCPTCNSQIERTVPNWALLKNVTESDYDRLKTNVFKILFEMSSYEKIITNIEARKRKETNELVGSVKNQVETQVNEIIKHINFAKNEIFKEIETNARRINEKLLDLTQTKQNEKNIELKEKLQNNNLTKEELLKFEKNLIAEKDELESKMENIISYSEEFEFYVNDKNILKKNLLGKILTKQV
jgi:hypothetical protein